MGKPFNGKRMVKKMKIKIRQADRLFSKYLRDLRHNTCEVCGRSGTYKMEASHYFGRGHENTRFDEQNVRCLCFLCHQRMGGYMRSEQGEYDLFMKKILGERDYKKLKIRAFTYHKKDDKMILLYLKQKGYVYTN